MEKEIKPDPASPVAKNPNVKTYVNDMAKALDGNKEGTIRNLIHEQERIEDEKSYLSPESKKNKVFMIIGLSLLGLGAITFSTLFFFKEKAMTVDVVSQFKSLIPVDSTSFLEIGGIDSGKIGTSVFNQVNISKINYGELEAVYPTENKKIIGLRRFLALAEMSFVPREDVYVRDNFLMGVTNKEKKNFFVLLKARNISDVFPSLRDWENKMFRELHNFFGVPFDVNTNYLSVKGFEDAVVNNQNARILYDKDRNIVMLYVFADNNSVVITNSNVSAREVMLRLASGEIKK